MTYLDALLLLYEFADKNDRRFPAAAARWHARFVLDASLPLGESEMLLNMLGAVRSARREIVRRQLLERVERAGLSRREIGDPQARPPSRGLRDGGRARA